MRQYGTGRTALLNFQYKARQCFLKFLYWYAQHAQTQYDQMVLSTDRILLLSQGLTSWVSARLHANVIERLRMIYSTVGLYGVIK